MPDSASVSSSARRARHEVERRVRGTKLETVARSGYAAKGVVYCMIGIVAFQAAFLGGGGTKGSRGVLAEIARQPFGSVLLALVVAGLFAYAAWRFVEAIKDVEGKGDDAKGLIKRAAMGASGVIYLALAIWGVSFLVGTAYASEASPSSSGSETWTAKLMRLPLGRWIIATAGAAITGVGLYQFWCAVSAKFMEQYAPDEMSAKARNVVRAVGRTGLAARGVTFVLIGWFLAYAAYSFDPGKARGLRGTLDTLSRQPHGPWLLGIVAVGLIAYGIHCFARARHRRFAA